MDVDSLDDLVNFEKKTGWKLSIPNLSNPLEGGDRNGEPVYMALQKLVTKC